MTKIQEMKWQIDLVMAGVLYRVTIDQAKVIAAMCIAARDAGGNSSVWHQSALHFGHPCNCVPCSLAH